MIFIPDIETVVEGLGSKPIHRGKAKHQRRTRLARLERRVTVIEQALRTLGAEGMSQVFTVSEPPMEPVDPKPVTYASGPEPHGGETPLEASDPTVGAEGPEPVSGLPHTGFC